MLIDSNLTLMTRKYQFKNLNKKANKEEKIMSKIVMKVSKLRKETFSLCVSVVKIYILKKLGK